MRWEAKRRGFIENDVSIAHTTAAQHPPKGWDVIKSTRRFIDCEVWQPYLSESVCNHVSPRDMMRAISLVCADRKDGAAWKAYTCRICDDTQWEDWVKTPHSRSSLVRHTGSLERLVRVGRCVCRDKIMFMERW